MDWKEFFKPTKWKIAALLAIFLAYNFVLGNLICGAVSPRHELDCPIGFETTYAWYGVVISLFNYTFSDGFYGFGAVALIALISLLLILIIIPMLIAYAMICAVFRAVSNTKPIQKNLKK